MAQASLVSPLQTLDDTHLLFQNSQLKIGNERIAEVIQTNAIAQQFLDVQIEVIKANNGGKFKGVRFVDSISGDKGVFGRDSGELHIGLNHPDQAITLAHESTHAMEYYGGYKAEEKVFTMLKDKSSVALFKKLSELLPDHMQKEFLGQMQGKSKKMAQELSSYIAEAMFHETIYPEHGKFVERFGNLIKGLEGTELEIAQNAQQLAAVSIRAFNKVMISSVSKLDFRSALHMQLEEVDKAIEPYFQEAKVKYEKKWEKAAQMLDGDRHRASIPSVEEVHKDVSNTAFLQPSVKNLVGSMIQGFSKEGRMPEDSMKRPVTVDLEKVQGQPLQTGLNK